MHYEYRIIKKCYQVVKKKGMMMNNNEESYHKMNINWDSRI